MSKTVKGGKPQGYEFWSKRPCNGWTGRNGKKLTHKIERQKNKKDIE
jgi:hypothetical protein